MTIKVGDRLPRAPSGIHRGRGRRLLDRPQHLQGRGLVRGRRSPSSAEHSMLPRRRRGCRRSICVPPGKVEPIIATAPVIGCRVLAPHTILSSRFLPTRTDRV